MLETDYHVPKSIVTVTILKDANFHSLVAAKIVHLNSSILNSFSNSEISI